jgi:hypothetical protein
LRRVSDRIGRHTEIKGVGHLIASGIIAGAALQDIVMDKFALAAVTATKSSAASNECQLIAR